MPIATDPYDRCEKRCLRTGEREQEAQPTGGGSYICGVLIKKLLLSRQALALGAGLTAPSSHLYTRPQNLRRHIDKRRCGMALARHRLWAAVASTVGVGAACAAYAAAAEPTQQELIDQVRAL